jgi:hypothetical protein
MSSRIEHEGLLNDDEAAEWRNVFGALIADGVSLSAACAQADEAIRAARRRMSDSQPSAFRSAAPTMPSPSRGAHQ